MAAINHTDPSALLGKSVLVLQDLHGVTIEHRGVVTGVLKMLPGARLAPAVFIEQPGAHEGEYFHLDEVTITLD